MPVGGWSVAVETVIGPAEDEAWKPAVAIEANTSPVAAAAEKAVREIRRLPRRMAVAHSRVSPLALSVECRHRLGGLLKYYRRAA